MVASIIQAILAIAQAVPVVDKWIQQLMVAYAKNRIATMKQENVDAIKKIIQEKDQRAAEKILGNPKAGLPSGDDGAVVIDHPPGVPDSHP